MKKRILFAALSSAVCLHIPFAYAQSTAASYPDKPIRVIVPFAPGGSVDIITRLISPKLSEKLGQTVVVENRSGASGIIGSDLVAKAKPDGYTLLVNTIPFVANQYLYKDISYDALNDFAPVSLIASSPSVLLVNPSLPIKSVAELIQAAQDKPGTLDYGAAGVGTNPHIAGELFNKLANVEIRAIQYRGGGPAITAVWSGEVGLTFSNVSEASAFVTSGKLRALAVTGAKRSRAFPDLPTVAEAGVPEYEFSTWHGLLAPAGTPDEVVRLINEKLIEALQDPEIAQRFEQMGLDVIGSTPEEFAAHLQKESTRWGQVIKDRNIVVE